MVKIVANAPLRFPYVHVLYVRFTKLVTIVRVTTYDLRQVTSPIARCISITELFRSNMRYAILWE